MGPHGHHGHFHPHGRRRRMGPMGRYVRSKLRRRLFWWFGGTIFMTVVAVSVTMASLSHLSGVGWMRDYERVQAYVGHQLEKSWGDPALRDAQLKEAAATLGVDAELLDEHGAVLSRTGEPCRRPGFRAPVTRGGGKLGEVRVCFDRQRVGFAFGPWRTFFVLLVAATVLWAASGRIARRIARPLDELTEVVRRLGSGDYSARSKLGCYETDEIGVVSEAVNDMAAKIQKQLSDQRELLATVSHELRTPLARMRIISELGRDVGPTVKTWDDLDREVVEMDGLVGELLASSRLEFEALGTRELEVKDAAARALERAGLPAEKLELLSQVKSLKADPTLLARALANLLENARKHAGGADRLTVRDEEKAVVFEVSDRGPGLPEGGEAKLFEAFGKGSDTRGEGLGLGLALVRRIAKAHGGDAFARQREGGGAVIGVRLPI